jgi:tetratricopeptide (TPR) repeat protein
MLVTVFTPNLQSLLGLTGVIENVVRFRGQSPDTRRLTILPLPSRIETARPSLLERWRIGNGSSFRGYQGEFETVLGRLYGVAECDLSPYFDEVQIQHVPDYAYGEELAVISEAATDNRLSLKRSYEDFMTWVLADTPPWIHPSVVRTAIETRELCEQASHALDNGELDSARRIVYLALDQPEAGRLSEGLELAAVLARLASAQADAGHLAEAEQSMAEAVRVAELALGNDDPITLAYTARHADLLVQIQRPAEARERLHVVVSRRTRAFGSEHIAVAEAYEKLGAVLGILGDTAKCADALTKGLEIRRAIFGSDQPFQGGSLEGLAEEYSKIGAAEWGHRNYGVAEEWYRLSVAIYEKLDDLSGLADAYQQLGDLSRERKDYDAYSRWNGLRLSLISRLKSTPTASTSTSQAVLRLVATRRSSAEYSPQRRVDVFWQDGPTRQTAVSTFAYHLDEMDAERIRWYLEDYPEFPADPAPLQARDAESVLANVGAGLFTRIFAGADAATIWQRVRDRLAEVRVEVDADLAEEPGLAWELLRDPGSDTAVALGAGAFVRTHLEAASPTSLPQAVGETLRVLLVICRPGGGGDVPYRSVAGRLIRGGAEQMAGLDLHVLRPATFAALTRALHAAYDAGLPYHVVHFDGHGAFLDFADLSPDQLHTIATGKTPDVARSDESGISPLRYGVSVAGPVRPGRRGYLVFEDPDESSNQQLVDGASLGMLLATTGVPLLVMNACKSAHTETSLHPGQPDPQDLDNSGTSAATDGVADVSPAADMAVQIGAYSSLAADVADAGVPGVVAMRYNVYVVAAAQFVADLYAHLLAGRSLGQAATAARRALADNPIRQVGATPVELQDWSVPVVYEVAPLVLLRPQERAAPLIQLTASETGSAGSATGPDELPRPPDAGFFGRDDTLLALDRAFDTQRLVLLHAFAGAGKSATAAEFARWYAVTGGLDHPEHPEWGPGPVLWSSFEHHLTAERVIGTAGDYFAGLLEANGIAWAALTDSAQRRALVMQVLAQLPVLWVWDHVEPVAGFPAGTPSAWTPTEQDELASLLLDLAEQTQCKVLLTSRRDERTWLGDLPAQVSLPPMPMRESLQLAAALATRHGVSLAGADWRPLLRYAAGNPLTISVLVGQALRENLSTTADIEVFLDRLRAGEAQLEADEDAVLGRTRSLAASLSYGFAHAFTDAERAQLAVLHLFRDTADVDVLHYMGDPEALGEDAVPELAGLTRAPGIALLDRAAGIGLLESLGSGYYAIHPALPWYFTTLYTTGYGPPDAPAAGRATRAYIRAIGALGHYYMDQAEQGRAAQIVPVLGAEEANLRHALDLARAAGLWQAAAGCLQALSVLYQRTGRDGEWARLVAAVTADFTDPVTGAALPGREEEWSIVTSYRVRLARQARDWATATTLQNTIIALDRDQAATALAAPVASLTPAQRNQTRDLAVSLVELGNILRAQNDPGCLPYFAEALELLQRIADRQAEAQVADTLGTAYLQVSGLRDLDQAEHWFQHGLSLRADSDQLGRGRDLASLGAVALERFSDARAAGEAESVLLDHLNAALRSYQQALDLNPADDHEMRAVTEHQLGNIYRQAGDTGQALRHYQQAIKHDEVRGDTYAAGQTRYSIAGLLAGGGRTADALIYARAALRDFERTGPGAADEAAKSRQLITSLETGTGVPVMPSLRTMETDVGRIRQNPSSLTLNLQPKIVRYSDEL